MEETKERLAETLKTLQDRLIQISDAIYESPEIGCEEYNSSRLLTDLLSDYGFQIRYDLADMPTAFIATADSGKPGPNIGLLCEYDALPGLGHGCCHNMIGTMSAGAGAILSTITEQTGGRITVIGTPGEENYGGKVFMCREGIIQALKLDVAMILHPDGLTHASGPSQALHCPKYTFHGKPSHAGAAPAEGVNALNGVIELFNGINALRQHVTGDVRISGIISEGGLVANIVPDRAVAKFHCRAAKRKTILEVLKKVDEIAKGAAMITGTTVESEDYEVPYASMTTNETLSEVFNENLRLVGITDINPPASDLGAIDMGNVSEVVPSIHPWLGIGNESLVLHTKEMADYTITDTAHDKLIKGTCALAYTGYDVLTKPEILSEIRKEFEHSIC